MRIKRFEFNAFSENTYVLYDETKECIIVDPGCYDAHEQGMLSDFIKDQDLDVKALLNTHCHIDHVLGNAYVKNKYGVELYVHKLDIPTLKSNEIVASIYGFDKYQPTEANQYLEEGRTFTFGNTTLNILFVPGHAPGHIALLHEAEHACIGGDVLFLQSIGRTDLPGGDFDTLIDSIKNKLFRLPDDTKVYCGHGPSTTIGYEKQFNPYCGQNTHQSW